MTKDTIPLEPHIFYVLLALSQGDRHGSDIRRVVHELSDGSVQLWPVKLYSSLEELVERGWIGELEGDDHPEGKSRRRRYYRLTRAGCSALANEGQRLAELADAARRSAPATTDTEARGSS